VVTGLLWGPAPALAQASAPAAVAGELLVRMRGPLDEAALRGLEQRSGGRVLAVLPGLRVVRLALPTGPGGGDTAARAVLGAEPGIESVEPNAIGRGGFVPDDPGFPAQWHLANSGQGGGLAGADIDASAAWDVTRGSEAIVVAILDTGADFSDPDLAGRLLPGADLVNGDADASADHPHGEQVTRLFGANADNGAQVAGVDHFARILPVKVLDEDNLGTTVDLAAGLVWAADQGAHVISMSLIDYPASSPTLQTALQYARDAGAVLVACAGNGGPGDADVSGPGAYPETISVGWTDATDSLGVASGDSSATGLALDVVAPGAALAWALNTGGSAFLFSGCSAATPVVAGVVSLLLSVDPALSHDEVAQILAASAEDQVGPPIQDVPGRDDFYGDGRVNAAAALALVPEPCGAAPAAVVALAALARRSARPGQRPGRSGFLPTPNAARTRSSHARTGWWSRASRSFV
jgi:subtilisin family serine protease